MTDDSNEWTDVRIDCGDSLDCIDRELVERAAVSGAVPIVAEVVHTLLGDMRAANHIARERFKMAKEVRDALPAVESDDRDVARAAVHRIRAACDRLTLFGIEAMRDAPLPETVAMTLLRRLEWFPGGPAPDYDGQGRCGVCGGMDPALVPDDHVERGHRPGCVLAAFLTSEGKAVAK
jgi:hypothetical protein